MNTLFGRKIQQTQGFLENGARIPVTVIAASENVVMGFKTQDTDNYTAIRMGFGKTKKSTKALLGEMKKANITTAPQFMREVKLDEAAKFDLGATVKVDEVFKPGDIVDVIGMSKGKGFAGGVKRYGFKGGPKTHGQSDRHRAPGSIGSGTTPGRVYRGKRMAGNMGRDNVTVKNLLVINVDADSGKLFIKGLVPGILNGMVTVTKVGEVSSKKFVPFFTITAPETAEEKIVVEEQPVAVIEQEVAAESEKIEESQTEKTEAIETKEKEATDGN